MSDDQERAGILQGEASDRDACRSGKDNSSTNPRVGVPIAFDAEAWCLSGLRRWKEVDGRAVCVAPSSCGVDIIAVRSGVGKLNGVQAARWLVREGAKALMSLGVAGGLRPELKTGDLIIADRIMEERDDEEYDQWELKLLFTKLAQTALFTNGIRAGKGSIVSVKEPVSSSEGKRKLYRKSHALVSDMESGSIARTAEEADVPILALRVVIDPFQRKVDRDLTACLDRSGRISLPMLMKNLRRRPSLFPHLLMMTRDMAIALRALRGAWRALRHALPPILLDRKFGS